MGIRKTIGERISGISKCEAGVAYIEFAICIGVLIIMFFGAIEVSRYILIVQKVEKTVDTLTDVLTQSDAGSVDSTTISTYLGATQSLMNPYTFGSNGLVILTGIEPGNGGVPTIAFQVCGGGALATHSKLGSAVGSPANTPLPLNFVMGTQDNEVVFGEIFYNYTPLLTQSMISPAQVYRVSVFKPRFGQFTATGSTGCPP